MLERIPEELKLLPQWVCATTSHVKVKDKLPIDAKNGKMASPTDLKTWATFDQAVASKTNRNPHVSFVLSANDPYTIIDLDDPYDPLKNWDDEKREKLAALNQSVIESFDSYTEISQSGNGVHIIIKGSIPHGVNRDTVELYCTQRHMITTGNVFKDLPIIEAQEMLDRLFAEMDTRSASTELVDVAATEEDSEIVEMAMNAANGEKFTMLCNSVPDGVENSEMDFALLSIIAFYTDSNEQCRRIFRMTARGKREKVIKNDKYLNYSLQKIRANQLPQIDFTALAMKAAEVAGSAIKPKEMVLDGPLLPEDYVDPVKKEILEVAGIIKSPVDMFPSGLIGRIAAYIYESSPRQVPEIALMASLGYISGIVGRQYNVSGVGLNQYLVLLAKTGVGKEGIAGGIGRMNRAIRKHIPMVSNFGGPSAFASGPALVKTMSKKPVFLSVLGEFGMTLQRICDPRRSSADATLCQALLDLYQKSGKASTLMASVYSDSEKDTQDVEAPALSILGESTPEEFYEGLSEAHISSGLIPRFTILECKGKRPYLSENHSQQPSELLESDTTELVNIVLQMQANKTFVDVEFTAEAKQLSEQYERHTTDLINRSTNKVICQLWNRAHLKLIKLAALIAVGIDMTNPTVDKYCFEWAQSFVENDIASITKRFEKGDIGGGENKQEADLKRIIKRYFKNKPAKGCKEFHAMHAIPVHYLRQSSSQLVSFKKDQRGSGAAFKARIADLIENGELQEVPKAQALNQFKTTAKVLVLGDQWFDEE